MPSKSNEASSVKGAAFIGRIPTVVLALIACFLWSTAFAGVKIGLSHAGPFLFAGMRFTLAGLILLPFAGGVKRLGYAMKNHWRTILTVSLFQTVLLYSLFFLALSRIDASTGAIVNGISPLIGALMAHFFLKGDNLSLKKMGSFIVALFGVLLVSAGKGSFSSGGQSSLLGILMMLTGSACGSWASIVVARKKGAIPPVVLSSLQILIGGLTLLILSFFIEGSPVRLVQTIDLSFWIALVYLAIVSAAGFSIWFYLIGIRKIPVTTLSLWKFMIPISGAILSWILINGDSPDILSLCGMGATATAVLLYFRGGKKGLEKT